MSDMKTNILSRHVLHAWSGIALLGILPAAWAAPAPTQTVTPSAFTLSIFHINDHHSHLQPDTTQTLTLGGKQVQVESGGFPRVTAFIKQARAKAAHPLTLHAGDAVSGDLYYTLFAGKADAELMNTVCFDAFEAGNHEFDNGDTGFRDFLEYLYSPRCQTPALGANIVPEVGHSALTPNASLTYLRPYTIKHYGKEQVGIIGIETASKTKNSSSPDASTQFLDERTTAQKYIDQLTKKGINKIVVLSHFGYDNDLKLARQLNGVDVIVGGDSHTLLGNFHPYGLNDEGPYPTREKTADGKNVCIVQAWQYAQVVGELNVHFNTQGDVTSCVGTPHLLLGNTFTETKGDKQQPVSASDLTAITKAIQADPQLTQIEPDPEAEHILDGYKTQVAKMKHTVIGKTEDNLCLVRYPGEKRSSLCDVAVTRAHGADISNLVAQAFLHQSITAELAIQNGGGVRVDVPKGNITIGDAYLLLPFANSLTNLTMTGKEIRQVLNEAVAFAMKPNGSTGAYPYGAGIRYDVDLSKPVGQQVFNIQTKVKGSKDWIPLNDKNSYRVVTNSYTALGKDGYQTFATVSKDGRATNTYLDYAQSFVDYVKSQGTIRRLPIADYSTQHFYNEKGELQK
jgi:5'-nucleotidase/UDP-sugar diphosphatase